MSTLDGDPNGQKPRQRFVRGEGVTAVSFESGGDPHVAVLRKELACRDEIIVALQHVIRDQQHELENLRVENRFAVFACERSQAIL